MRYVLHIALQGGLPELTGIAATMPYADKKSCTVDGREIIHGEFVSLMDRCFLCIDGQLVENYDSIYGGIAGAGAGSVWDNEETP
ncbi:MAG: hypothetical protein AB9866_20595 [Syntrophobacteraceae bacterium]